jgi:hypothetical protein
MKFGAAPPNWVQRPLGVTILGILQLITSVVLLTIVGAMAAIAGLAAFVIAPFAIISLLFALAVFTGRNWARILMMVAAVFDILSVVGIVWGVIVLWYLTRPRIIAYFKQPKVNLVTALLGR